MGLLPPPEPKVRLANLMRVLKDTAVADPSAVERAVRDATAAREGMHAARNAAGKLTPAERAAKWRAKMTAAGPSGTPSAALFAVADLRHGKARYKVDMGAKQLFLTGVALLVRGGGGGGGGAAHPWSLVYVEGGFRAVTKFATLMLRRVDWGALKGEGRVRAGGGDGGGGGGGGGGGEGMDEEGGGEKDEEEEGDEDSEDDGDSESGGGEGGAGKARANPSWDKAKACSLVWKGVIPKLHCTGFHFEEVAAPAIGRRALEMRGLAHMWDAVANTTRPQ
jgi:U4/U6 small nuclear ribonucleoprotein PRP3